LRTLITVAGVGLLALCVALAVISRFLRLRHSAPTGAWDGKTGAITLTAGLDQPALQKTLVHELSHVIKDSGLFKRDLATLWEAYVMWQQWEITGDSLVAFRKGLTADGPPEGRLSDLELYVRSHDQDKHESPLEYSMGYFVFGRLAALCREDPDLIEVFITLIMRGDGVGDAWAKVRSLPTMTQSEDEAPDCAARLSLWTEAYLTGSAQLSDDYVSQLLERGREVFRLNSVPDFLEALQSVYSSNSSQWGTPLAELAALLAGYLQERSRGNVARAIVEARMLKDESFTKGIF
jgi:hypothetical protein